MNEQISKYFDLSISNEDLYSIGPVEEGHHGIEVIDGEYYASLYHIKNLISKGELKNFLTKFNGTAGLYEFALALSNKYKFESVLVKYKNQRYTIKKYPYSAILDYFLESRTKNEAELKKQIQQQNTIGLSEIEGKSYRRFKELNSIQLSKINFFVGQNNAGKSTVVEMVRVLVSYLKQPDHSYINLNQTNFGRILNSTQKENNKNEIELGGKFDDCTFRFKINGVLSNSIASISLFHLDTPSINLELVFHNEDIQIVLELKDKTEDAQMDNSESHELITELKTKIIEIDTILNSESLSIDQRLVYIDQKNKLEKEAKLARNLIAHPKKKKTVKTLFFETTKDKIEEKNPISILNILKVVKQQNSSFLNGKKETEDIVSARQLFNQIYKEIDSDLKGVFNRINLTAVHYLQGASIKLGAILKSNENHAGLLNSMRYLNQEEVFTTENHIVLSFIKKWLGHEEGFGLATDIRVKDFENEVFTIELLDDEWQYVGDLGLGAQHLFELIISIAKIILYYEKCNTKNTVFKPMLLIEEPESHIHPALQSKLADFFYQVNLEYDLRFIVETHSEYLIRKTQLISLENGLLDNSIEKNPFNVIYFDKKNGPYTMNYTKDGRFDRDFGEGFYDVVDDITLEIFLNQQSK